MSMKSHLKTSTSLFTGALEDHQRSAGTPAAHRNGETPSVLWDDLRDLAQVDVIVQYEDGSFGRPLVDLGTWKVVEGPRGDRR